MTTIPANIKATTGIAVDDIADLLRDFPARNAPKSEVARWSDRKNDIIERIGEIDTTENLVIGTDRRRVDIERFRRDDLIFEADADMGIKLAPFGSGTHEQGAVLVLLNVDAESRDIVTVERQREGLMQIQLAIETLTEVRDELKAMGAA